MGSLTGTSCECDADFLLTLRDNWKNLHTTRFLDTSRTRICLQGTSNNRNVGHGEGDCGDCLSCALFLSTGRLYPLVRSFCEKIDRVIVTGEKEDEALAVQSRELRKPRLNTSTLS